MLEWIRANDALLWGLGIASVVMFLGSLAAIPIIVTRLPADHFASQKRHTTRLHHLHPALWWFLVILKNLLGAVIAVAGVAMLVLPGQGILAIVLGLSLIDFPGKYRLQRWLVQRRSIRRSINWIRHRFDRPPLVFDLSEPVTSSSPHRADSADSTELG